MKRRIVWIGLTIAIVFGTFVVAYYFAPPRFLFLTGFKEISVKEVPGTPAPPADAQIKHYVGQVPLDQVRERFVTGMKKASPPMVPQDPSDARNRMWFAEDPITDKTVIVSAKPNTYPTDGNMIGILGNRPGWTYLTVATQRESPFARMKRFFRL